MDISNFDTTNKPDKNIEKELNQMYDLKRTDSTNIDNLNDKKNAKDSLVTIPDNKYDIFKKLKKNLHNSHQRIKDFNQKKLQKFPQLYQIKYLIIYDPKNKIYQKRTQALSKYTVKLFLFSLN